MLFKGRTLFFRKLKHSFPFVTLELSQLPSIRCWRGGLLDKERQLMSISSDRKLLSVCLIRNELWWRWSRPLSSSGSIAVFSDMTNDGDSFRICPSLRVDNMIALQVTHLRNCESCLEQNWVLNYPQRNYNHEKNSYLGHFGKVKRTPCTLWNLCIHFYFRFSFVTSRK